jgi:hypothetical protein
MLTRVLDSLDRHRLRRAAVCYAEHGWAVVPGAVLVGDRFRCDTGCPTVACHPARETWRDMALRDPAAVPLWWARQPRAILLATGRAFDVLDVPAFLGQRAARDRPRRPVAVTGAGRWMFLVRPGAALRRELACRPDVVLHGEGSWIPAPPTQTLEGQVRWLVDPEEVGWRLPDPRAVQASLVAATGRPHGRWSGWREAPASHVIT